MGAEPLLMRFSTARTGSLVIPGHYDDDRQVWVIDTPAGVFPIVESTDEKSIAEIATKTDAAPERDDPSAFALVELTTKTAHQLERDDVAPRSLFLELVTVTKVGSERPDM